MKDRSSKNSRLSHAECYRFQRAIYRVWLYSVKFPYEEDLDYDTDSEEAIELMEERKTYIAGFATPELLEIERAAKFLVDVFRSSEPNGMYDSAEGKSSSKSFLPAFDCYIPNL